MSAGVDFLSSLLFIMAKVTKSDTVARTYTHTHTLVAVTCRTCERQHIFHERELSLLHTATITMVNHYEFVITHKHTDVYTL